MNIYPIFNRNITLLIVVILGGFLTTPLDSQAQRKGAHKGKSHQHKQVHKQVHKQHHKKAHAKKVAHHKYKHLPRRGHVITALPNGVVKIKHKGANLHFHNGVFYKSKGASNFVVARAPIGARVKVLPPGHRKIVVRKKPYVYYYGTFYSKTDDTSEYEVVEAPVGAQVDAIPDGYEMEEIDGVVYYTLDDAKYLEKETDGDPVYVVVK